MSYRGQGQQSYSREENFHEEYDHEEQYEEEEEYGDEQMGGRHGHGQQGMMNRAPGGPKGGQRRRFPHPDIAAQYYAKATGSGGGSMNKHEDMSGQDGEEDEEQWGEDEDEDEWGEDEDEHEHGMQMQHHGGHGHLGGHFHEDPHHQNVMAGLKGIHDGGWTEEHKKSAIHVAGYLVAWGAKWAGLF